MENSRIKWVVLLAAILAVAALLVSPGLSGPPDKVTICHKPPGNPAKAINISINASAVPAHLAHGDTLGPCSSP